MNETSLLFLLVGLIVGFAASAPIHTWLGKKLASAKAWEAREKIAVEDKWTSALALARALSGHVREAIADVRAEAAREVSAAKAEAEKAKADLEGKKADAAVPAAVESTPAAQA